MVLDEPTNYLDIDTRERVEEALMVYPGGLVMVSHDRYLHSKVANRLVILEPSQAPKFFKERMLNTSQKTEPVCLLV